ncbi:hypothetical protein V8G54_028408 [Vigna mungo]|uniref:Uncharacterized protein n=1 Tax=Vigna mungo TaxID=3915 RepID=A0AAQ3MRX4_VIGMU
MPLLVPQFYACKQKPQLGLHVRTDPQKRIPAGSPGRVNLRNILKLKPHNIKHTRIKHNVFQHSPKLGNMNQILQQANKVPPNFQTQVKLLSHYLHAQMNLQPLQSLQLFNATTPTMIR